ncbi:MAG TPA: AraC family transcriptional regulator [Bosea sp. (in: a-proteobacteria)]|uniref:helix-turn-helix transcriptional regulator n=1 Tax=Bosea sp. (in: a-proteobacteria) TaxID=1871050 RepID=UPI002E13065A|nr:AraC family transcriptional regulator [Bosea sp. (in: a-proteobacteria)]
MQLFSNKLSLSAGRFQVETGKHVVGPMRAGLKIGVILDGRQSLELDDRPAVMVAGPSLLIAANSGEHMQRRTGLAGGHLRCALLQFDLDFVESEFGAQLDALHGFMQGDAALWVRPANATLCALALQLAEPPVADNLHRLYLAGKALELAAVALDTVMTGVPARPARMPHRTAERIREARDIMLSRLQDPPGLPELARMTGLNPTNLTSGFRQLFGASVFGYLQEQRLQRAHALIDSGEMTVSEAAFHVGYTPAHFSSLFRKRFGMPPSALR